jgi:hypothetical protein
VHALLNPPTTEIYTDGLYSDSTMLDAARAAIDAQKEQQ